MGAFLAFQAFDSPGVRCVEGAVHRFASTNIDDAGLFVIQVFSQRRSAAPYACFKVERKRLKRKLRAGELDHSSAGSEIKFLTIYVSRKMGVKVTQDRIKVDFDDRILDQFVGNVIDRNSRLVASGEHRRVAAA